MMQNNLIKNDSNSIKKRQINIKKGNNFLKITLGS